MNYAILMVLICLIYPPETHARGRRGIPIKHKRVLKKKVYKSVGRCIDPVTKKWANGACP